MPIKNAPNTTWYKPLPVHRSPSPTRHAFQQVPQTISRPGSHVPGQHQSSHSQKTAPLTSPSGLPCSSMKQTTSLPSPQVPPSEAKVPEDADGQAPPLLPSKLPTSTSGSSSSSSSSPKRSIPQTKIASPTRVRNTDRLPPIAKGVTSGPGGTADKGDCIVVKVMTPTQKDKKKEEKDSKEKVSENTGRRRSSSVEKKSNRENSRTRKLPDENVTCVRNTNVKKKSPDNISKLDAKSIIIPKRKKSYERSTSENEIKPKKINLKEVKELPIILAKIGESQHGKLETTANTPSTMIGRRSSSKDRGGKCLETPAVKQGRKISPAGGPSSVSPSNKKLRPSSLQAIQKDPIKDVEKMLKEMDFGKTAESNIDETDLGKSIEKSLESAISAKESQEINAMECNVTEMEGNEQPNDVKDICMEEESVERECVVHEEGIDVDGKVEKEEKESVKVVVVTDHEVAEKALMGSENNACKNVDFASESHSHHLPSQVDTMPLVSLNIGDNEDAESDHKMRKEDESISENKSMEDQMQTVCNVDLDHSMEDDTLVVSLAHDGTVEDVMLMEDSSVEVLLQESSGKSDETVKEELENMEVTGMPIIKTSVRKMPKGKTENKTFERENKMKTAVNGMKLSPKNVKKMPEKQSKKDVVMKKEVSNIEESKLLKKKDEEVSNSERRIKRKIDTDRTRGGTKKPAILFVDKDVDKLATTSRPVSPCPSDVSSSSDQSHSSNLSHVSSRLPIRALHVSGPNHVGSVNSLCSTASGEGGDSRASRDSRVLTTNRVNISNGEKKRSEASAPPRRPRLDNIKSTIPKPGRLPPRKLTDPVKAARPGGPASGPRGPHLGSNGGPGQQQERQHPVPHAEQLRRLDAELTARAAELKVARTEKDLCERRVEALTVLIHHLNSNYEPFLCPTLKAEVVRLNQQLTDTRLSLDESSAAVRRLQDEATQSVEQHSQKVQELEQRHKEALEKLTKQHQQSLDFAIEKHRKELGKFAEDQQTQREDLSRAHTAEIDRLEGEWRTKLDLQHEKHLCAVQELNTQHTHKLRELESSRQAREFELEEANHRLHSEQETLKIQSKKLEESLLNDTDHRLQAVRNMCTSLKSEVDSLKTVVEMKNSEIHTLRGQVVEMGRLSKELEIARDRAKTLQAKTEDLQAQMEKRSLSERHLVNEHRLLMETCQREANMNKRLSLENEELAWKLRQREEMYTSLPSSTLDLVSRSPATPRRQEGAPSPQAAPHSPRVAVRSASGKISPSKCEVNKRRSRLGLSSEDGLNGDDRVQDVSIDSPPPSPCVKAVVEKSNSVSFILDLNDSQSDDSFLDLPPSPRPRPQRTASLSAADRPRTPIHARRVIHNNRANSLNRNGVHLEGRQTSKSELNGKRKELNGKSHDTNGHGSQPSSGRSASESSEGGSEMERVSPTGLAWTVPVHPPKSPVKTNPLRQNGSPVRGRVEHHLLEDPDEDEYEETPEGTHQFIEVVELSRVGLVSSSEAASDSELSQCDLIKGGSSTDSDSESSDGEPHTQKGPSSHHEQLARKNGPWCPKEGAGEAMITDELLKQYAGDTLPIEPLPTRGKRPPRRCFPSAPSSDSDDNMNAHNEGNAIDVSWSEDITSSSEMHEL